MSPVLINVERCITPCAYFQISIIITTYWNVDGIFFTLVIYLSPPLRTFSFPLPLKRTSSNENPLLSITIMILSEHPAHAWIFATKLLLGKLAVYSTVFHRRHFLRLSTLLWNICCFARMWNDVRVLCYTTCNFPLYNRVHTYTSVHAKLVSAKLLNPSYARRANNYEERFGNVENLTVSSQPSIFPLPCRILSTRCFGTLGKGCYNVTNTCKLSDILLRNWLRLREWPRCNVFTVICCHFTWSEWVNFPLMFAGSLGTSVFDTDVYLVGASGGVYALLAAHLANVLLNYNNMEFGIVRLIGIFVIGKIFDETYNFSSLFFNTEISFKWKQKLLVQNAKLLKNVFK